MCNRIYLALLLMFFHSFAYAQEAKVRGSFLADSVKIGEEISYTLTASYSKNLTLIFPDSTFSFTPFEFQKKKFFATKTTNGLSYDSVVYLLSTFEIDSVQKLKLPVFVVHKSDCTSIFSETDEVILKQLVRHVPDTVAAKDLPLKTNTNYLHVKWLFNYPVAIIISGILLISSIAGFFIFGKRIRKYFMLRKLNRNHQNFITKFNDTVSGLRSNFSTIKAETALVHWKYYMEGLLQTPYSKLTSKEILNHEKDEQLGEALRTIDRVIYGGISSPSQESFDGLRNYCEQQFQLKLKEVSHGG